MTNVTNIDYDIIDVENNMFNCCMYVCINDIILWCIMAQMRLMDGSIKHTIVRMLWSSEISYSFFPSYLQVAILPSPIPDRSDAVRPSFWWTTQPCLELWWTNILQWKITIFNRKIHYKWPFSIAICMFTRGYLCLSTIQLLAPLKKETSLILQEFQTTLLLDSWIILWWTYK